MSRNCIKCGYRNGDDAAEACPNCGALYRSGAAWQRSAPQRGDSTFGHTPKGQRLIDARFAETVRAETLYPTFRAAANAGHWLGIALAVVLGVAALLAIRSTGIAIGVAGISAAVLLAFLSRAMREGSHMVADMADATMRLAADQQRK